MAAALVSDAKNLLQKKEQEIAALRETALQQLEVQLSSKELEYRELSMQLEQLKNDFRYNLGLLEERDMELEKYDSEHALLAATLADKERLLAELQKLHSDASSELRIERAKYSELEFLLQAKRTELQRQLEDERISHAEASLRQHEECEQAKRALQRALSEAEEQLQQQRREMAVSFQVQMQQLEAKYRQEAVQAKQEAEIALQQARQREEEAKAARVGESEQMAVAEAALFEAREKDKMVQALSWELDQMKKLKDSQISDLGSQISTLQQVAKAASQEAEAQLQLLSSQLASARQQAAELSSEAATALSRQQALAREESAILRVKLEQVQSRNSELESEVREQHAQLRSIRVDMQARVEELERELRLVRETSEMALTDYERRRESELVEVKEQLWAQQQEVKTLRDRLEGQRKALEEKRADVAGFKERLAAAGDRERDLQRKLMEAELRLEQQTDQHHAALEAQDSQLVKRLTEQRDAANSALKDAQSRLLDKESEIGQLRDKVSLLPRRKGTEAALALESTTGFQARASKEAQPQRLAGSLAVAVPAGSNAMQESTDSLTDALQLPSPSALLLSESASSPTRAGPSWLGLGRPAGSAMAAAAAARAEMYLRSSKEGLDELLSPSLPGGGSAHDSPTSHHQLQAALLEAEQQNQRLRSTLAIMRGEIETLQAAVAAVADTPPQPQGAPQESDRGIMQALEQYSRLAAGALEAQDPAMGAELSSLRQQVQQLSSENLQLRRLVVHERPSEAPFGAPARGGLGQNLAAFAAPAGGIAFGAVPSPGTPTAGRMTLEAQQNEPASGPGSGAASRAPTREEEALQRELAEATSLLDQLRSENGRLMEMSNALRAERDRVAIGLALLESGRAVPRAQTPPVVLPAPAVTAVTAPAPQWSSQQLQPGATGTGGISGVGEMGGMGGMGGIASQAGSPTLPYLVVTAVPYESSIREGPLHGGRDAWRAPSSQLPPSETAAAQPPSQQQQVAAAANAVHFFSDSSLRQGGHPSSRQEADDDVAAAAAVAVARAEHRSRSAERSLSFPGSKWSPVSSQPALLRQSESMDRGAASSPPRTVPGSASSRETHSQRARLQAMQRRAEEEASRRPKARNYNLKEGDD